MPPTPSPSPAASATVTAPIVIVRLPTVRRMTALGRSTIYRLMALKLFPSAIKLGPRAVGWRQTDIAQWLEDRPDATH